MSKAPPGEARSLSEIPADSKPGAGHTHILVASGGGWLACPHCDGQLQPAVALRELGHYKFPR